MRECGAETVIALELFSLPASERCQALGVTEPANRSAEPRRADVDARLSVSNPGYAR